MKGFNTFVELVMGSNLASLIEFSKISTFSVIFNLKILEKSENNIICVEPKKGTEILIIFETIGFKIVISRLEYFFPLT